MGKCLSALHVKMVHCLGRHRRPKGAYLIGSARDCLIGRAVSCADQATTVVAADRDGGGGRDGPRQLLQAHRNQSELDLATNELCAFCLLPNFYDPLISATKRRICGQTEHHGRFPRFIAALSTWSRPQTKQQRHPAPRTRSTAIFPYWTGHAEIYFRYEFPPLSPGSSGV